MFIYKENKILIRIQLSPINQATTTLSETKNSKVSL